MKRKFVNFIIVLVVLFQTFIPSAIFAEAKTDSDKLPEVCSWPSGMMVNYFNFQREAINILLDSEVNERLLQVSFGQWGLFRNNVLSLSAIDVLATNVVWNLRSSFSNFITSIVLFSLISSSVLQSNVEWLAILVKDRPVVRDYKEMLDIETQIFDVAYFRSKQINLTRPLEWNMVWKLNELINKYQEVWLLEKRKDIDEGNISMADVMSELLEMNSAMKHFIMVGGNLWKWWLESYYWCFWAFDKNNCNKDTYVLKISTWAIDNLSGDYKEVRSFSKCNSFVRSFNSSINKTITNNTESLKVALQDVKDATKRLRSALRGKWAWSFKNNRKSMCDNISEYEMAQLKAYRWPNWTCGSFIKLNTDISSLRLETTKDAREKETQTDQKSKSRGSVTESQNCTVIKNLQSESTTEDKKSFWDKVYWSSVTYDSDFSVGLNSKFEDIYNETMNQYWQSLDSAIFSDSSNLLSRGKWILDTIDKADAQVKKNGDLRDILQKIADKQCSG